MKVQFHPQIAEANRGGRSYNGTAVAITQGYLNNKLIQLQLNKDK